jgi:hypothetical protein
VGYAIHIPANKNLELEIEDLLFRSPGRPSRKPLVRYKSFQYQADSWITPRRIVAKVEHHVGELFPRVGFIVKNLALPNRAVVRFYNKRGTAEQWIKRASRRRIGRECRAIRFRANEVRLQLSVLAYNLGNLWRRLVLPKRIDSWSLTSLQQRLVKTGWAAGQARPLLLASCWRRAISRGGCSGRCSSGSGRCPCQPADRRALTETVGEERTEGRRSVRKNVVGVVPRGTIRAAGRGVSMRDRYGEESGPERALVGVGCDPINGHQIGNVGLGQNEVRSGHRPGLKFP